MAICITVKDPNRKSRTSTFTELELALYKISMFNSYAPLHSYYGNNKTKNGITTSNLKKVIGIKPGDTIYLRINNIIMAKGIAKKVPNQGEITTLNENLSSIVNDSKNYSGRSMMRADSCMTLLNNKGTDNRKANWIMLFDDAPCFLNSRPQFNKWGQHIYVEKWVDLEIPKLAKEEMFDDKNTRASIRILNNEVARTF
jgi:hypothetical protein